MSKSFASKLSFRKTGESTKTYVENPEFKQVEALLGDIDAGLVECVTLYGPADERLFVLGKPGFYHLTVFVDETDGYAFDDGSEDRSNIAIAGDYWPSFRVCKDHRVLVEAAKLFYEQGGRTGLARWQFFSEDA